MQNEIVLSGEQQLALIEQYGGLEAWGGEVMAPHYAAAWAWAGNFPFQWGKQVASHLGGTRSPMVVSWPRGIADKGGLRSEFTHVIDIGQTILEAAGIPAPAHRRHRADADARHSFLYSFADADRPSATPSSTSRFSATARCTRSAGWRPGCCRASRGTPPRRR